MFKMMLLVNILRVTTFFWLSQAYLYIFFCQQENLPTTHKVSENFQLKLTVRENVGSCIGVSAGAGARAAKLYFPEFLNFDIDVNNIGILHSTTVFPYSHTLRIF